MYCFFQRRVIHTKMCVECVGEITVHVVLGVTTNPTPRYNMIAVVFVEVIQLVVVLCVLGVGIYLIIRYVCSVRYILI